MKSSLFFKNYFSNRINPVIVQKAPSNVKTFSFLNYFLFFLFVLALLSVSYYHNIQNPRICEIPSEPLEDNLFWKIQQTGVDTWNVLFKNVNINYLVTASSSEFIPYDDFRFKEIQGPGVSSPVDHTRLSNSVSEAVMVHFNCIQRGEFHPNTPNLLNPNAHGRGNGNGCDISSPLDQFEVRNLLSLNAPIFANLNVSLTNIGLYLTIAAFLSLTVNLLATNYNIVVANNWSISQESIYATIHGIVINQINAVKGQIYFPFIYALFIFILVNNLIGMVPYSFATTSHFILTFFISFTVVLGSTILGFSLHELKFFSILVPSGCPLGLLPLLVLIELISYLARNISLGLRLAANVLSGHMLLNILSGFAYNIMNSGFFYFFFGLIPLAFIIAFSALELGIAFIQAQVFVVLSSSYVKDALDLH